jgi:hypothetical protein
MMLFWCHLLTIEYGGSPLHIQTRISLTFRFPPRNPGHQRPRRLISPILFCSFVLVGAPSS